jgi:hypothetical protein
LRILFDKNVALPLRHFLAGHEVEGAGQLDWNRLSNGDLLQKPEEAGFEVFITDWKLAERPEARPAITLLLLAGEPSLCSSA